MTNKTTIEDPIELDHVMDICRDLLTFAVELLPRLEADDPGAQPALNRDIKQARDVEQLLKEDAVQDANPPAWCDLNDPGDVAELSRMAGNTLEQAARKAYQQTAEWRCCVVAPGSDGVWHTFTEFELAWTRLVLERQSFELDELESRSDISAGEPVEAEG